MANEIHVTYDDKLRRLIFRAPMHLNDVIRSLPSRRFDPKSKTWKAPLVKQNVLHIKENAHKYDFKIDMLAQAAIDNFEIMTKGPVHTEFPRKWYAESGNRPPLPHQWFMLDYGWNLDSFALIAAMGTGKTYVTINTAMARWKYNGLRQLHIITLKNLHNTWRKEFKKWHSNPDDYTIMRIESGKEKKIQEWLKTDPEKLHVFLIGVEGLGVSKKYAETARFPYLDHIRIGPIQTVVDESSRIKNHKAARSQVAADLGFPASEYRTILNGTPIAKGLADIYQQYEFLNPHIIGSGDQWAFRCRYLVYGGYEGKQLVGYDNVDELMNLIQPYTLEVNKSVLNLPPKTYKEVSIEPTAMQLSLMKQVLKGHGPHPKISVQNVLERDLRLQQIVGGFQPVSVETIINAEGDVEVTTELVPLEENPKFDWMTTMIDENISISKFIIWAKFIPELEMIIKTLEAKYGEKAVLGYYGAIGEAERITAEDRYCNDPAARFFVGNPSAAGLGLTLISGENDIMVYYSGTFAYIDRTQSEDRAHRIGQKNELLVIDPRMENTIDILIKKSIEEKKDLDQYVKQRMSEGKTFEELLMEGD